MSHHSHMGACAGQGHAGHQDGHAARSGCRVAEDSPHLLWEFLMLPFPEEIKAKALT